MSKSPFLSLLIPVLVCFSGIRAEAADVNIQGRVVASACTIGTELSSGQSVSLGTLSRTQFQVANDADSTWHPFLLELTDCPAGTTKSIATFSGTADSKNATLFANTEPSETAATNMAVQMSKQSDNTAILSNGSTMTVNITDGTASFPLAARMYTPTGSVQAGKVSSTVLVDFTYQ